MADRLTAVRREGSASHAHTACVSVAAAATEAGFKRVCVPDWRSPDTFAPAPSIQSTIRSQIGGGGVTAGLLADREDAIDFNLVLVSPRGDFYQRALYVYIACV